MPNIPGPEERVVIGVVVGSHGLQGTLKIDLRTDFPERFEGLKVCTLCKRDGSVQEVRIKRCKFAPRGILLTLEGIRTREHADILRGATIELPLSERWQLPEDSYYISDLIGCRARTESGDEFGEVEDVIRGSQDVLVLKTAKGEVLVPFVDEWVGKTDVTDKYIVIRRTAELVEPETIPPALGESDH
ncbi:MAG: 16S rRNA processing protein RimM [Calditrichaeota bacterium]|nr:16S rRNA processing protein RimM [Calditrichota bacterium]MCB9368217.1 16S rRNA processing protein RimM [Calditrichota bacterium]